jgi:hypothetical protein
LNADHISNFNVWKDIARHCFEYLIDLSRDQSHALSALPTDLISCNTISDMIPLIFRMYTIECSLYKTMNHFLRCFPIKLVGKFVRELSGILHYIYLLQSSLEYCSRKDPLANATVVYRVISGNGSRLGSLYESMIDEVIVWPSFTSTSTDRAFVIAHFIKDEDSILFEIRLHPGAVPASIQAYSAVPSESEYLIAASSGFKVDAVDYVDVDVNIGGQSSDGLRRLRIPEVKLSYCLSWSDFDINERPVAVLIESEEIEEIKPSGM